MRVTTCPRTDAHVLPALAPRARVMTRHTDAHGEWEGMRAAVVLAGGACLVLALIVVLAVSAFLYVCVAATIGN